jgi:hypothetical protein
MSLRSLLTQLVTRLPSLRFGSSWTRLAAVAGFMAVSSTGCGGCDDTSLQDCPKSIGPGKCICDSLGCRPASGSSLPGLGGSGGSATTTTATGGASTGGSTTGSSTTTTTSSAPGCDPNQAACPCDAKGQCPTGKACVSGLCIAGCNFTYECGAGKVCANGACVPGCDSTHGCSTGYQCVSGACLPDPANPQCSTQNPCPSPEICQSGLCTSQCSSNSQCADGEVCDGATQTCIPDPSPKPVCSTAMPCPANEVCEADGFCHFPCTSLSQCALIDNRFVACAAGVCKTSQEVNPQCTLTMPCPLSKSCISNTCL